MDSSPLSIVWSRVRIPSSTPPMLFPFTVKFLFFICHCVEKRTEINKKRPGLAHIYKLQSSSNCTTGNVYLSIRTIPPMWPDWAIYLTLGNFSKPFETINLSKSPTFLGNFCKGFKILNFSSELIFGQLL